MPNFKGTVYISTRMFVEQKLEAGALDAILAEVPEPMREALAEVSPAGWCDTEPVLEFHRVLERLYGSPGGTLCIEAGHFSATWNMNTILKLFLRFKSPLWITNKAGSVWDRYHDTGAWTVVGEDDNRISAELRDFAVTEPLFFRRLTGWLQGMLEATGGKNPVVRHTERDGVRHFDLRWE